MGQQLWTNPLAVAPIADGAAYASSTSLTQISPTPDVIVKPNTASIGQVLRVSAFGRVSTTATPTLLIAPYWGGVGGVLMLTGAAAITCGSGITNLTWTFEATFTIRSIGSSGTIIGAARIGGISGANAVDFSPASAPTVATIDTTAGKALVLGATWGTNSGSNTITVHGYSVEAVG